LEEIMKPDFLELVSKQLGLVPYPQDWGIANADPSRLEEFLAFYDAYVAEDSFELEALAELILQSAEDAMVADELEKPMRLRLLKFIADHGQDFPDTLEYWSELEEDDWQVPGLIREARSPEISRRFS
jgi:hypothetical protein